MLCGRPAGPTTSVSNPNGLFVCLFALVLLLLSNLTLPSLELSSHQALRCQVDQLAPTQSDSGQSEQNPSEGLIEPNWNRIGLVLE